MRYLGVVIDSNLKWDIHIFNNIKRLRYLLYVFSRLNKILTIKQLLILYYGLFHSIATYGVILWGGAYEAHLHKIQVLQKKALKIIYNKKEQEQKIKTVPTIRQQFFIEASAHNYQCNKNSFLNLKSNTRNKEISLPLCKNEIGKHVHSYISIKLFNKFPNALKTLTLSSITIKTAIKKWILTNNYADETASDINL